MAITKTIEISKIEVVSKYKNVQVRTDTVIKEDGTELSRSFHRHTIDPGKIAASDNFVDRDISGEDSLVQDVCNIYWTDEVKEAYRDFLISQKG